MTEKITVPRAALDVMLDALEEAEALLIDMGMQSSDAFQEVEYAITVASTVSETDQKSSNPAWRPIESAPRNGTLVLLATDGGIVFVGKLNKHLQLWVDDEGRERFRTVTHWMTLPSPPEVP